MAAGGHLAENSCAPARPRGIGGSDEDMHIPLWVRIRIEKLGRQFVGQIVLNVYEGGIPNFTVRPRGGDAVTFHCKR